MKETIEHNNRFYGEELKTESEQLKEWLIERLNNLLKETSQTLSEQNTKAITLKSENERLNKELKSLQDSYDIEEEQANYHIDLTDDLREEVDRLNNIIKDIKSQLDYLETYSSKEDVFEDMKRRLDRIDKIIGSDKDE